jgi:hypothetical protein
VRFKKNLDAEQKGTSVSITVSWCIDVITAVRKKAIRLGIGLSTATYRGWMLWLQEEEIDMTPELLARVEADRAREEKRKMKETVEETVAEVPIEEVPNA